MQKSKKVVCTTHDLVILGGRNVGDVACLIHSLVNLIIVQRGLKKTWSPN